MPFMLQFLLKIPYQTDGLYRVFLVKNHKPSNNNGKKLEQLQTYSVNLFCVLEVEIHENSYST